MKTSKYYVPLLRKWVKEYVSNMDIKELQNYVTDIIHHDLEEILQDVGQESVFQELIDRGGIELFNKIKKEVK